MAHYSSTAWAWSRVSSTALGLLTVLTGVGLPQETPGLIERRFQPPPAPTSTFQPLIVPGGESLPLQEAARIKFTVAKIVVEHATLYTDSELRPLYKPYLNRQISLADAYQLADAITAKYRHAGYPLAQAIVPTQTVSDGTLTINVVEGTR